MITSKAMTTVCSTDPETKATATSEKAEKRRR
jgi:hypothetical protein